MLTLDTFNLDAFLHSTHREEQHAAHLDHMKPLRQSLTGRGLRGVVISAIEAGKDRKQAGTRDGFRDVYLTTAGRR